MQSGDFIYSTSKEPLIKSFSIRYGRYNSPLYNELFQGFPKMIRNFTVYHLLYIIH